MARTLRRPELDKVSELSMRSTSISATLVAYIISFSVQGSCNVLNSNYVSYLFELSDLKLRISDLPTLICNKM